ncbi:tetratricopeptide repeat protein [Sungkyunkwania multivorans]|uniref:Tetratricopeptide repeat protein n=1 Tax=Sungkyunkwania multivorans TaxID=1173618 RepID=A0ABW3D1V1_9FLAO
MIDSAQNNSFSVEKRRSYLKEASAFLPSVENDSVAINVHFDIALTYYRLGDKDSFRDSSKEILEKSRSVKDSIGIGRALGFLGNYFLRKHKSDSAYQHLYEASKIYKNLGDEYSLAKVLLDMAIIQKNGKDFIASEATTIEALSYFENLEKNDRIAACYNNLAIIANELQRYDDAIEYYKRAIEYDTKNGNFNAIKISLNNMGVVYERQGDYNSAIELYDRVLSEKDLAKDSPSLYAFALDNLAHTKLESGYEADVLPDLLQAYRIRDSIGDSQGLITSFYHLAKYHAAVGENDKAINYAVKAKDLSYKSKDFSDILKPLLLLIETESGSRATKYAKDYIRINDSLQKQERALRNQFARIRFETDKIASENELISRQRLQLMILLAVLFLTGFLLYIIKEQRARNKKLVFEQEQQQANEEIYNLMLAQHGKLEEGRLDEQRRISRELHDGVLSRLFGTRLNLDVLNPNNDENAINSRKKYIDELKNIEEEIRHVSHNLSSGLVEQSSFLDIIKDLLKSQEQINGYATHLDSDTKIDWEEIPNKDKIHCYRIVQEAIQNINKHSKAKNVTVKIRSINNDLILSVIDDGVGFNIAKKKDGIGLKNIQARVEELKGFLDVFSKKGEGTEIRIEFSLRTPQTIN